MSTHQHTTDQATDEAAVRTLLAGMNAAWGDADAYGATFTTDADYVTFFGGHARGRQQIIDSHRPLFEGVLKGSRLHGEVTHLRFLGPDVALIHGRGAVLKRRRQRRPSRRAMSVQTFVAVREQDGQWRLTAFHNTRYRPLTEALTNKLARLAPTSKD